MTGSDSADDSADNLKLVEVTVIAVSAAQAKTGGFLLVYSGTINFKLATGN